MRTRALIAAAAPVVGAAGCFLPIETDPLREGGERVHAFEARDGSGRIDALALQALVMAMADDYASEVAEIVYLMLQPVVETAQERALALSFLRNSFGAAVDIAAGPNPEVALLDLLVLSSLQRATFERHWIPEVWGEERGAPVLARLDHVEERLWRRAEVLLTEEQRATLKALVGAWLDDNPDRLVVELVRFSEFADARHLSNLGDREAATGLLKDVARAVNVIDDARLLGERALWYAGRLPYIIGEQTELTAYRILADPDVRGVLAGVDDVSAAADRAVAVLESVPEVMADRQEALFEDLRAERRAAIDQLGTLLTAQRAETLDDIVGRIQAERQVTIDLIFDRWQREREETLDAVARELEQARATLPELRETIAASTELARTVGETTGAVDRFMARYDAPTGDGADAADGMAEAQAVLAQTAVAAERLTALLDRAESLLDSPRWEDRIGAVDGLADDLVDRVFWRTVILVALVFGGVVLLRRFPRR